MTFNTEYLILISEPKLELVNSLTQSRRDAESVEILIAHSVNGNCETKC